MKTTQTAVREEGTTVLDVLDYPRQAVYGFFSSLRQQAEAGFAQAQDPLSKFGYAVGASAAAFAAGASSSILGTASPRAWYETYQLVDTAIMALKESLGLAPGSEHREALAQAFSSPLSYAELGGAIVGGLAAGKAIGKVASKVAPREVKPVGLAEVQKAAYLEDVRPGPRGEVYLERVRVMEGKPAPTPRTFDAPEPSIAYLVDETGRFFVKAVGEEGRTLLGRGERYLVVEEGGARVYHSFEEVAYTSARLERSLLTGREKLKIIDVVEERVARPHFEQLEKAVRQQATKADLPDLGQAAAPSGRSAGTSVELLLRQRQDPLVKGRTVYAEVITKLDAVPAPIATPSISTRVESQVETGTEATSSIVRGVSGTPDSPLGLEVLEVPEPKFIVDTVGPRPSERPSEQVGESDAVEQALREAVSTKTVEEELVKDIPREQAVEEAVEEVVSTKAVEQVIEGQAQALEAQPLEGLRLMTAEEASTKPDVEEALDLEASLAEDALSIAAPSVVTIPSVTPISPEPPSPGPLPKPKVFSQRLPGLAGGRRASLPRIPSLKYFERRWRVEDLLRVGLPRTPELPGLPRTRLRW